MKNELRNFNHKKNEETELLLKKLDKLLTTAEKSARSEFTNSKFNPIFIIGCARSGTTITHQYLVNATVCSYPSNFLSRFYSAPIIGSYYLKLFTELDNKDELLKSLTNTISNTSEIGKTKGILSPNEFWYFWRSHFPTNNTGYLNYKNITKKQISAFRNSIYGIQEIFQAPFICKAMIANNNPEFLLELFPNATIIYQKRDILDNAISLYTTRQDYFGDVHQWYSFKTNNYNKLKNLSPYKQVIEQVKSTNNEIEVKLLKVPKERIIQNDFESFCKNPEILINELTQKHEIDLKNNFKSYSFFRKSRNRNAELVRELSIFL